METLTKKDLKQITSDSKVIEAAENVFITKAYRQTVEAIVNPKKREVLQKYTNERGEKIINPEYDWTLNDNDFQEYQNEMHTFYLQQGLNVSFDYCPLLIAEDNETKAEHALIKALEPYTGIAKNDIFTTPKALKIYYKYIDLNLKLLAPFINKEKLVKEYH